LPLAFPALLCAALPSIFSSVLPFLRGWSPNERFGARCPGFHRWLGLADLRRRFLLSHSITDSRPLSSEPRRSSLYLPAP
jgi:hypothetical protein